ncbi:hypothetical protein [Actinomadura sp. 21ATH]|uniref:hypothetical protein n=1 Tax=Actinomadura sp. 21ATH TaxID=1735444 RepID=UPI0035C210AE
MKHETTDPALRTGTDPGKAPGAPGAPGTAAGIGGDRRVAGPAATPAPPASGETGESGTAETPPAPAAETAHASQHGSQHGSQHAPGRTRETSTAEHGRLLEGSAADGFHERWREVQSRFVDDPRGAVRQADELAAEIVNAVGQALAARKRTLDERLNEGGEASPDTERLRLALRDYRDFVDRTLTL